MADGWLVGRTVGLTVGAHGVVDTGGDTEKSKDTSEGLGTLAGGSDGLARTVGTERNKVSCRDGKAQSSVVISMEFVCKAALLDRVTSGRVFGLLMSSMDGWTRSQ